MLHSFQISQHTFDHCFSRAILINTQFEVPTSCTSLLLTKVQNYQVFAITSLIIVLYMFHPNKGHPQEVHNHILS
jgi:hypothetical protein